MINWQLLVDEELRENVLRHVDKCEVWDLWIDAGWMPIVEDIFCLNTNEGRHPDFVVQEPSAQDIIDAVCEETRDMEEWKNELDENSFLDDPRMEDEKEEPKGL